MGTAQRGSTNGAERERAIRDAAPADAPDPVWLVAAARATRAVLDAAPAPRVHGRHAALRALVLLVP